MSTPFTLSPSLPEPSTTATPLTASLFSLNWLLGMAGYGGAPTYTAPSTPRPGVIVEAAAAVVAEIVEVAGAGGEMHPEPIMTTTVDGFTQESGVGRGTLPGPATGRFSFRNRGNRGFRGAGNVLNYLTSSWALLCIFMAILLNRTLLYASLRRPTRLNWQIRLLIRIIPIICFVVHIISTLYALRCQTSPYLSLEEYPLAASIPYNFDEDRGGFLYVLSRILTLWLPSSASDPQVCQAFGMLPPPGAPNDWTPTGSLSILWPLYRTISIGLFLSTFSHALQGPTSAGTAIPSTSSDTGLTLFEDSLAFAEAEALVDPRSGNVSPEVLYIALISAFAHLTANIIGVLVEDQPGGIRARGVATVGRFRLVTTGIWGVAFLGGFTWALWRGGAKVLGFPTVCVVGFIPHLMVVAGIAICGAIYLLAAFFSALAPTRRRLEGGPNEHETDLYFPMAQLDGAAEDSINNTRGFFDFSNLQANITLSTLTISWNEDFYTTLLKLGFQCLTAASEATYLNEGAPLRVPGLTWLERERIRVLERQRKWAVEKKALGKSRGGDAEVAMLIGADAKKGYGNEKKEIKSWMVGLGGYALAGDGGGGGDMANERSRERRRRKKLGGITRGKKWFGAVDFVRGATSVVGWWSVRGVLGVGKKFGLVSLDLPQESRERVAPGEDQDGENDLDDAAMQLLAERWIDGERDDEDRTRLYAAFLSARRLFPQEEEDDDEEYTPSRSCHRRKNSNESDLSSLSLSSSSWSHRSGSITPTPETPCPPPRQRQMTRWSVSGAIDFSVEEEEEDEQDDSATDQLKQIATLLDPQTPEQRSLAKIMSAHLSAPQGRHVTRHSMSSPRHLPSPMNTRTSSAHNPYEEEVTLESLILAKRPRPRGGSEGGNVEERDADWGPCVVCQISPRTVVVWPCRCLALCEECRVSLAMRNFGTCVCCRREVGGVSRVFAV